MENGATWLCSASLKRVAYVGLSCAFSIGGALIGLVTGALKGQTTETGFARGALIGVVAGAVVALEVLDSCFQGELLSKIGIFDSLVNGKVFPEWVSPAMLKAYQWQLSAVAVNHGETSDLFDVSKSKGLLPATVKELPQFVVDRKCILDSCGHRISCAICLQDFKGGESARRLRACGHIFHILCIDDWLVRDGSCPICRQDA